jgi:DNA-binding CsgD family transcriptional regulator
MSHRRLPNANELLGVMRHLADVTSLRADPAAQRLLLVERMTELFHTTLGWLLVLDDARPDRPLRPVTGVLPTATDPCWRRYTAEFNVRVPAHADPYASRILRQPNREQHWTRRQVLPDAAALRRFDAAAQLIDEGGIGDGVVTCFRTGPALDRLVALSLHRSSDDPRMTAREHALQRFTTTELRRLVEAGQVRLADAPLPVLPPRPRQVLEQLAAGRTPTAIARHLGLSVWTVRDHVKTLHAHYGVRDRGALMARVAAERSVNVTRDDTPRG